jgi:hypothetical protein
MSVRLYITTALVFAMTAAASASHAATLRGDCGLSGGVAEPVSAAISGGSFDILTDLLVNDPALAADVLMASQTASDEQLERIALAFSGARLDLMASGDEAGAAVLSSAAACGGPGFAEALGRGFRLLLVRGQAPGYTVPLFYDNFGGGLVSRN